MNVEVQFFIDPRTLEIRAQVFGCRSGRRTTITQDGTILGIQTGDLGVDTVAGALSEWFQADADSFDGLNAHKIGNQLKGRP